MSPLVRLENFQQFAAINVLSDPGHLGGPVVIPNAVQIVFNWVVPGGKIGHNVLYGRTGGVPAPTVAQAQSIFAALSSGAQWTAMATQLFTSTQFTGVTLRSVHAANQPIVQSTGAAVSGTGVAQAVPSESAVCVTLRTGLTGPQNRGRLFLTGWCNTAVSSGNLIDPAVVTAVGNWANTITGALSAQGYTWSIGQPARATYVGSTGTIHPPRSANTVPITSAVVRDNRWDSQRRRGLR